MSTDARAPHACTRRPSLFNPLRITCAPPHPTHSAERGLSALSVHSPYQIDPHLSPTRQRNPPGDSAPSSSSESPLSAPSSRRFRRAGCTQQVRTPSHANFVGRASTLGRSPKGSHGRADWVRASVSLRVSSKTAHPRRSESFGLGHGCSKVLAVHNQQEQPTRRES